MAFEVALLPNSNDRQYQLDPTKGGGMFALRIDNGERMWQTPPPGCGDRRPCSPAQSAAVTSILSLSSVASAGTDFRSRNSSR